VFEGGLDLHLCLWRLNNSLLCLLFFLFLGSLLLRHVLNLGFLLLVWDISL
jgi:hypothetical protein